MEALIASVAKFDPIGGYIAPYKMLLMLLMALPWWHLATWSQKDAQRVGAPDQIISGGLLGVGILGMLVWILLPNFLVGMVIYLILVGGTGVGYVLFRNTKVPAEHSLLTGSHFNRAFDRHDSRKTKVITRLKVYDSSGRIAPEPEDHATVEEKEAYNLTQQLLYDLLFYRASEADVTPSGEEAKVRFLVDGAVTERPSLEIPESEMIIASIKQLTGLDTDELRKPQQGQISVDLVRQPVDLVVTTAGTTSGQRLQLRVVQESIQTRLTELGPNEDELARINGANQGTGLVLVASRGRNGLSSTLYSLLRSHDAFVMQLATLEPRIASDLENVGQQAYKDDPAVQRKMLTSLLRQEPNVVMIEGCADAETAALITGAARDRLIILGLRGGDTFNALARWIKVCGSPQRAIGELKLVMGQTLIRKLCPECHEAYQPDPALLSKANLKTGDVKEFFRPPTKARLDEKGKPLVDVEGNPIPCPTCRGTGYYGRTGLFEIMEMTDELRGLIVGGAPLDNIKAACRKNQMLYLQDRALQKVVEGVTSIEEVIRVTQSQSKKSKPKQPPAKES